MTAPTSPARSYGVRRAAPPAAAGQLLIDNPLFRHSRPYSKEFARVLRPEQLNETTTDRVTLGVVSTYVSLLYGHQREVEDTIYLSTVHAVARRRSSGGSATTCTGRSASSG
jgi:hypothetical protein